MFKKLLYLIIIINLLLFNIGNVIVIADDENEDEINESDVYESVINVSNSHTEELNLNSRIAIAYDRKSGKVIWGKNENKRGLYAS